MLLFREIRVSRNQTKTQLCLSEKALTVQRFCQDSAVAASRPTVELERKKGRTNEKKKIGIKSSSNLFFLMFSNILSE